MIAKIHSVQKYIKEIKNKIKHVINYSMPNMNG
jgi:hypothetical protein